MKAFSRITMLLAVAILALGATSFAKSTRTTITSRSKSGDAWMGVYTQTVDKDLAKAFNLNSERGVVVNEVVNESPADKAGLKEEDVILSVNGKPLNSSNDLSDLVDEAKPGDRMALDVARAGHEMQITITLGDRSDNPDQTFSWSSSGVPKAWTFNLGSSSGDGSFIGVQLTDLTPQLGDYFGVKDGNGVLIDEVEKDSPAEKAGLKAGDIIVAIGDEKVADSRDVSDLIQDQKSGTTVSVGIIRDHAPKTISVEVEKRKTNGYLGYGVRIPRIPTPLTPSTMHGLYFSGDDNQYFDSKEFHQQMEDLRKQLLDMKQELKDNQSWKEDLRKLQSELRELQQKMK
jgi:membrane-associated protease RseP (regulator of RpoE activity)